MFSLFGKKAKTDADPLGERARSLKCRQISYEDVDPDELEADMKVSADSILKLKPVNYYAVKNEYILAFIYTSADYEENYVRFERISFEKRTGRSKIYALDRVTVSKALAKVGVIISDGGSHR